MERYEGVVEQGQKRGRELGYPTANIASYSGLSGVFAGVVHVRGVSYKAAVFADPKRHILEAHLVDFNEDLYGERITIEIFEKLRDAAVFSSDDELKKAIASDIETVRSRV